jgi:chromosomal replication initiation ATPase DnaA
MNLHAPTIRHVLDCLDSFVAATPEKERTLVANASRHLHLMFQRELDKLPAPIPPDQLSSSDEVLSTVAQFYGTDLDTIFSPARTASLVRPRQAAAYIMREHLKMSYPEIGAAMHRDHSTIIMTVSRAKLLIGKDSRFEDQIVRLVAMLVKREARA